MSNTQRTLAKMRKDGFMCAVTEHWNPWTKTRKDLFSFVDVLCVRADTVIAVQTTSGSNAAARVAKIRGLQSHEFWLAGYPHRQIHVHSWKKRGERGKRKVWDCVVIPILPPEVEAAMREIAMDGQASSLRVTMHDPV